MSRQRTINDQIWRSNRMSGCTVEDRYALFYFLTSPFSNVIGAYEIVIRVAASEMGWDPDSQLMPVVRRLVDASLIDFDPHANYIWIKDWWDHNSAKMAVASTLRKRTLDQIEALPQGWRDAYAANFINRLSAEDPLRNTVSIALGYGPHKVSIPYADPINSSGPSQNAPTQTEVNQGVGSADTLSTPYAEGIDRRPGNTTTNTNSKSNSTTTHGGLHRLHFPGGLLAAEQASIYDLLSDIQIDVAQSLLDELEGAIRCPGTIRTTKVQYLRGLVKRYQAGSFVAAAGIPVATRREHQAASDEAERNSDSTPINRAEGQARLQEIKAQLGIRTRMPQ